MNVLIGVHHFPPKYWGGGELRAFETAQWLLQQGHQVNVVCIESISDGDGKSLRFIDEKFEGIAVRRLYFNLRATSDPFLYSYLNPLLGIHLKEYLNEVKPDLFHVIGGYLLSASPLCAAHELRIPTVVTLLEFWFLCAVNILLRGDGSLCTGPFDLVDCARCAQDEKRRYRIPEQRIPRASRVFWHFAASHGTLGNSLGILERISKLQHRRQVLSDALLNVNAIVSPSEFVVDMFIRNGIPRGKIHLIDHIEGGPPQKHNWEKTPSTNLRFGFLGQLTKMKGVDDLINAYNRTTRRTSPTNLTIHGDLKADPKFGSHLQSIARQNPQVVFAGRFDRQAVFDVLREIDVLIFPSIWYENAPRVIREAFETGSPVIASNLGGGAEYVKHGINGLLFEPGNVQDLTKQLQRFIDEPELVDKLRQGIPRVKPLTKEMEELVSVYEAVIAKQLQATCV